MNFLLKIFARVPLSEKVLFAKHLSMMLKAGMSEIDSMRLIKRQIKSRSFLAILTEVIKDLENGQFLSVSLIKFKKIFGDLFINIIRIGETSGTLSINLNYLSAELKKSQLLRQKIRAAMIYPLVILFATLGVTSGLVFFILPKILPIFTSLKINLPLSTRILIGISQFLFAYWNWVLIGIAAFLILIFLLLKIPMMRYALHRLLFFIPFVSQMMKNANMANFTRTLALLLKSGVAIVEALNTTADTIPNLVYRKEMRQIAEWVKRGESIHKYLNKKENIFPPTVGRLIEVGEATGNLDENLFYLSDFYESEVDEMAKNLSSVLEPALLLIMGSIVGFVAVSIITPIYEITQNLRP